MWFRTLFDSLNPKHARTPVWQARRGPPRSRPKACPLAVEALEDRSVPASLSVSDVTIAEGNAGPTNALVTVNLSAPSNANVTVSYSTADGTALAGSDYQAASGRLTFAPGETSKSILVSVIGDQALEPNETVFVNLRNAKKATIADGQGVVIIEDDDRRISISDVSGLEGNAGLTPLAFTATLSAPADAPLTVNFATQDGTAIAGEDYLAVSGTLTFAPGETSKTITVQVIGDTTPEGGETFLVNLGGATNAVIDDGQGVGTIVNDEPRIISWDGGGGDFNWNNRFNWDTDSLPSGPFDDVVIGTAFSGITVDYGSGTTSVRSLDSQANLNLSGGSLTLNATSSINGDVTVSGGSLDAAGTLTVTGRFTNSGAVNVHADITVYGDYTQTAAGVLRVFPYSWDLSPRLDIGGTARLDGTLYIYPRYLGTYLVLTFSSRSGAFADIYAPGGHDWESYYEENGLWVRVYVGGEGW